ncbi:MAG: glycosyltransferase family 10 [Candidatus Staskawiczbacteria bacterium]|nr:glycosyltransferase family 10 [Candidatus Staskawiczbacteria bacterium]
MIKVYIDPGSYVDLENILFSKNNKYNVNNSYGPFIFLEKYCEDKGINLKTIDLWNSAEASGQDIYVAFEHKFILRKFYWKFRNKKYPIVDVKKFKKRILFQFEPPVVVPEIRFLIKKTTKIYDDVFFTWETGVSGVKHFHTPLPFPEKRIIPEYWGNGGRKFLTLINSNRTLFSYHKELITERIRAVIFFGKTEEIDLYGRDWDKSLPFPYWFYKSAIKKVYKGTLDDKYKKLSQYKFAFAIENCELPGYITEKIHDCLFVGTVPIYLGDPEVEKYIPKNCFINMRDFKNYEELRKFLKALTQSEVQTYKENGRRFLESEGIKPFTEEHFAETFVKVISKL